MKSLANLLNQPIGFPITADAILETHAARLLLLIRECGLSTRSKPACRIDGLTKFAKLDFFVRYPTYFQRAAERLGFDVKPATETVESTMVRFHYGPWDKRYYQVIPYLEAKRLISVEKIGSQYRFALTDEGLNIANRLNKFTEYEDMVRHMQQVKAVMGSKSGNELKVLIYDVFDLEVTQQRLGATILP